LVGPFGVRCGSATEARAGVLATSRENPDDAAFNAHCVYRTRVTERDIARAVGVARSMVQVAPKRAMAVKLALFLYD